MKEVLGPDPPEDEGNNPLDVELEEILEPLDVVIGATVFEDEWVPPASGEDGEDHLPVGW